MDTLYSKVKERIRAEIVNGKKRVGEQLPPEPSLCERYGVSRITLRRAVSELCADRLLKKVNGKGTFVLSTQPRTPRNKTLKVILPNDKFMPHILLFLEDLAHKKGFEVAFADAETAELSVHIKRGRKIGVAGYVIAPRIRGSLETPANQRVIRTLQNLRAEKVPFILLSCPLKKYRFDSGGTDNRAGGFLATRHLIEHGRRKIAYVSYAPHPEDALREAGYRDALAGHNASPVIVRRIRKWTETNVSEVLTGLLSQEKPDAIFAFNDSTASRAIRAAHKLGLSVPEDLAVVGYDNFYIAPYLSPVGITSLDQNMSGIAARALKLLFRRIAGDWTDFPQKAHLAPTLIVRRSCGCAENERGDADSNRRLMREFDE